MTVFTLLLYSDNIFSIKAIFILYKFTLHKNITSLWYTEYIVHGSKNGLLYDSTYFGANICRWRTPKYWPVNPTGTREKWRRLYIANREPLTWTETRDIICLPSTAKLSRRDLRQHTQHQYVNKVWNVVYTFDILSSKVRL